MRLTTQILRRLEESSSSEDFFCAVSQIVFKILLTMVSNYQMQMQPNTGRTKDSVYLCVLKM